MALFERPPLETLASAKDRWTPLYLEHGCLEVDDSNAFRETFRRGRGSAKGFSLLVLAPLPSQ